MMMLLACNDNGVGDNWKIPDVPNSMLYPQQRRVLARVHYFFRARSYVFKNASFFFRNLSEFSLFSNNVEDVTVKT